MKSRMLRILALMVVLSMMFTTSAFAKAKPGNAKHGNKNWSNKERIELKTEDYDNALQLLIKKEIVKGYGNGDYGLSGNVKRGDVIVMIIRMLEEYGLVDEDDLDADEISENYLKIFEDVEPDVYYYGPIKIAKRLGIAKGDGLYFKPNKPVSVQEAIWLIERAGDLLDIDFESDSIDELEEIYEDELNDFAKRRDIFWMLYFVIDKTETDEEDVELSDILVDMDSEQYYFDVDEFEDVFEDAEKDIEYITFDLPIQNGTLYYDEVDDENVLNSEEDKYYVDNDDEEEISDIIFVPEDNFSDTVTIKYYAYEEDDEDSYQGLVKINVNEDNDELVDISLEMDDDKELAFTDRLFTRAYDATYDNSNELEYIEFETLPDNDEGTLYYQYDSEKARNNLVIENTEYYLGDDESRIIEDITFVPNDSFSGTVTTEYTAYDEDGEMYSGKINIDVSEVQEIETLYFTKEYANSVNIELIPRIESRVDDDLYEDFDYIKFEIPDKGTLIISYNGDDFTVNNDNKDKKYYLDEIDQITFKPDEEATVDFEYTIYDKDLNDKAYEGVFRIKFED